jgi:transposase
MEACLSAHFVSRALRQLGHQPRIIPAIYLKPFVKGQKNDYNAAEAIAEAALRPNLRVVREKTQDQLDLQALHRVRSRQALAERRRSIRSVPSLLSRASPVRTGARALRSSLMMILENGQDEISARMRTLIAGLYDVWIYLDERIETLAGEIEAIGEKEANCRRLMSVPGVGPVYAGWSRGRRPGKDLRTRFRITTESATSTPCTWNTDFAISRPTVLSSPMDGSPQCGLL